ncbi:MAG: hypothetical protein WBG38_05970, partial [Nodosilinea sp.]
MSSEFSHKAFDRAFAAAATVAVAGAIAAGFWVLGTPGRQRDIAADRQRVQDISTIAQELHNRYLNVGADNFQLPPDLEATNLQTDPLTEQPYEYKRVG